MILEGQGGMLIGSSWIQLWIMSHLDHMLLCLMCCCGVDARIPSSLTQMHWIILELFMYDMMWILYEWK